MGLSIFPFRNIFFKCEMMGGSSKPYPRVKILSLFFDIRIYSVAKSLGEKFGVDGVSVFVLGALVLLAVPVKIDSIELRFALFTAMIFGEHNRTLSLGGMLGSYI